MERTAFMPSILLEIQETVMKYADIMSKIAQIEVEVVDETLYLSLIHI